MNEMFLNIVAVFFMFILTPIEYYSLGRDSTPRKIVTIPIVIQSVLLSICMGIYTYLSINPAFLDNMPVVISVVMIPSIGIFAIGLVAYSIGRGRLEDALRYESIHMQKDK